MPLSPGQVPRVRPADNPFRSERMDAVTYGLRGATWPTLIARALELGCSSVVGGHGSGKTRFLEQLAVRLRAGGHAVQALRITEGVPIPRARGEVIALIDGLEREPSWRRLRWRARLRGFRAAVVARHVVGALPVLHACAVDLPLARQLVDELLETAGARGGVVDDATLASLLARHRGNLREVFRDLYDRVADGRVALP